MRKEFFLCERFWNANKNGNDLLRRVAGKEMGKEKENEQLIHRKKNRDGRRKFRATIMEAEAPYMAGGSGHKWFGVRMYRILEGR